VEITRLHKLALNWITRSTNTIIGVPEERLVPAPESVVIHANLSPLFSTLKVLEFKPSHIVDVGAHSGDWSRSALTFFPEAKYSLFEPQKDLLENESDLDLPNVRKHYVGAGLQTEIRNFTSHDRRDSFSFAVESDDAKIRGFEQWPVEVVSLDEFFASSEWPAPDVLKVDAEGWDLQVLEGASKVTQKCELVLIEAAIMNKQFVNTAARVIRSMDELGFEIFDFTDLNRTPTAGALWLVEIAFVRKRGRLSSLISSYI
jgi:FkbM family methyltransferase